jgi:hypothetical protein
MAIFKIFGKKKQEEATQPINLSLPPVTTETATIENVKAKIDLILSKLDSIKTEQETLNERINGIERILKELYTMAKS